MKKASIFLLVLFGFVSITMLSEYGNNYNSDKSDSKTDDSILESGSVDMIEDLLELDREGHARGEIEAGSKIDYRKAKLEKGNRITFNVDCKQEFTDIKITLTEQKTGKRLEDNVIGKGELSFEIKTDGEYIVTIENCSEKGTHFTIEYRIDDKANII